MGVPRMLVFVVASRMLFTTQAMEFVKVVTYSDAACTAMKKEKFEEASGQCFSWAGTNFTKECTASAGMKMAFFSDSSCSTEKASYSTPTGTCSKDGNEWKKYHCPAVSARSATITMYSDLACSARLLSLYEPLELCVQDGPGKWKKATYENGNFATREYSAAGCGGAPMGSGKKPTACGGTCVVEKGSSYKCTVENEAASGARGARPVLASLPASLLASVLAAVAQM